LVIISFLKIALFQEINKKTFHTYLDKNNTREKGLSFVHIVSKNCKDGKKDTKDSNGNCSTFNH